MTERTVQVSLSLRLSAMALDVPAFNSHPNRMPFSGILTRVGVPSDGAPHGSNGKRVTLTHAAAEAALPSLLGMGVDLTSDLEGHDPTRKIGVITSAHIEGDALKVGGFIYAADFPQEALRVALQQADLGFSFEAQRLQVESLDADPMVIVACCFTGAAILMKDKAAYTTTALAAASAKLQETKNMDAELKAALSEIVTAGIKPISDAVAGVTDRLGTMEASVAALSERDTARAQVATDVEPLAQKIEAAAAACETAGMGGATDAGHVAHLRRLAAHMRSEAAQGRKPEVFATSAAALAAAAAPLALPKVEDSHAFIALAAKLQAETDARTAAEAARVVEADKVASLGTEIADLKAAATAAKGAPDRKTLPPHVRTALAKAGLGEPEGDTKLSIAALDKALEGMPLTQRMQAKAGMQRAGIVDNGPTG